MDINSINNNITSLNNVQSQQLSRSNQTGQIDGNDQFLKLSINEYNQRRDELSVSLQTYNNGIGISRTAVNGLEKQEDILKNVQDNLTRVAQVDPNSFDRNTIKNDVNTQLLGFREEAFYTRYKNESLLSVDEYAKNEEINISTKENYLTVNRPNTPEISIQIAQEVSRSDFNNDENLQTTIQSVENGINQIQEYQTQFANLEKELILNAKNTINEQVQLSNQNRVNNNIDFPKEVTDFSKSNINANAGYLAASQANIVQAQSVRLLT